MFNIYMFYRYFIVAHMPFSKKASARTHEEARKVICCGCARKSTEPYRAVNERLAELVRKFVFSNYSIENEAHPVGICSTCRKTLDALDKV